MSVVGGIRMCKCSRFMLWQFGCNCLLVGFKHSHQGVGFYTLVDFVRICLASDLLKLQFRVGALRLRASRTNLVMRASPGQKILVEVPSNANIQVVAAVQEVWIVLF